MSGTTRESQPWHYVPTSFPVNYFQVLYYLVQGGRDDAWTCPVKCSARELDTVLVVFDQDARAAGFSAPRRELRDCEIKCMVGKDAMAAFFRRQVGRGIKYVIINPDPDDEQLHTDYVWETARVLDEMRC